MNPLARVASNEFRLGDFVGGGLEGGIEPLHVAHLEHDLAPLGGGDQLVGLDPADAERLFDEQMDARVEKSASDRVMQAGGGGDHGRVDAVEQARKVGQSLGAALGGDALAIFRGGIDHGQQFDVVARGELLGVESTQASGADDGHAKFVHSDVPCETASGWRLNPPIFTNH